MGGGHGDLLSEAELATAAEEKDTHAFEIDPPQVNYTLLYGIFLVYCYFPMILFGLFRFLVLGQKLWHIFSKIISLNAFFQDRFH